MTTSPSIDGEPSSSGGAAGAAGTRASPDLPEEARVRWDARLAVALRGAHQRLACRLDRTALRRHVAHRFRTRWLDRTALPRAPSRSGRPTRQAAASGGSGTERPSV